LGIFKVQEFGGEVGRSGGFGIFLRTNSGENKFSKQCWCEIFIWEYRIRLKLIATKTDLKKLVNYSYLTHEWSQALN